MGKFAVLLSAVFAVCMAACSGESETVEDTSFTEVAVIEEHATTIPLPPIATSEPPFDTPVPTTHLKFVDLWSWQLRSLQWILVDSSDAPEGQGMITR